MRPPDFVELGANDRARAVGALRALLVPRVRTGRDPQATEGLDNRSRRRPPRSPQTIKED